MAANAGALFDTVEAYLVERHIGSWHTTLDDHASTRPKCHGGPLVTSVTQCKTFGKLAPGSASVERRCFLDLPNSFAPNDGRRLQTMGRGASNNEASENVRTR